MITIGDTFFPLLPTPFDSKLCNFYYSGSNIIIETITQYKTRVSINYRLPGVIITILLPKTGYTLQSSYPMSSFASILSNFDFKYYTYQNGVADNNFIELVLADISTLVQKDGDKVLSDNNFSDADKSKLDSLKTNPFTIKLPSNTTVAGRISGAVEGTDYPTGWILIASPSEYDITITHGLGRSIANISVLSIDGLGVERVLVPFNSAFTGWYSSSDKNSLTIEGLSTKETKIKINIIFE